MPLTRTKVKECFPCTNGKRNVFLYKAFYLTRKISSTQVPPTTIPILTLAPTSAGKTMGYFSPETVVINQLVAEILLIRQSTIKKKKCIVVLPFVSIVTEKTRHFRTILQHEKVEVAGFHGGARTVDFWDIAICTIERVVALNARGGNLM